MMYVDAVTRGRGKRAVRASQGPMHVMGIEKKFNDVDRAY